MDFNEYQKKAIKTLTKNKSETPNELLARITLGICDEAGEIAGKVKKYFRGDYGNNVTQFKKDIRKEIGDVLWYLAVLAKLLFWRFDFGKIAKENIKKLADRKNRNKIKGNEDNR